MPSCSRVIDRWQARNWSLQQPFCRFASSVRKPAAASARLPSSHAYSYPPRKRTTNHTSLPSGCYHTAREPQCAPHTSERTEAYSGPQASPRSELSSEGLPPYSAMRSHVHPVYRSSLHVPLPSKPEPSFPGVLRAWLSLAPEDPGGSTADSKAAEASENYGRVLTQGISSPRCI